MKKKTPSLKKIIKNNPRVDAKQLAEGIKLLEELRNAGLQRRGYKLLPPYSGKRVHRVDRVDSSFEDSRTVHLPNKR